MSNPWLKFYPSDWRADPSLRMCSIAARGLWMEMLCVMHENGGELTVNGKPVSNRQLASLAGCPDVDDLLAELEDAGVFSRRDDGTIYSRRMIRDAQKAEADKANGRKGGNPNIKGVNPQTNEGVNPPDKAQKPEARNQSSSLRSDDRRTPRGELETVLDADHAKAVLDHRQRIRKPLTAHAARLLAGKFSKCPDPNAAADAMVANGWQGFEPEWMDRLKSQPRGSPTNRPSPLDHFRNLARETDGHDREDSSNRRDWDDAPGVPVLTIEHQRR